MLNFDISGEIVLDTVESVPQSVGVYAGDKEVEPEEALGFVDDSGSGYSVAGTELSVSTPAPGLNYDMKSQVII